MRATTKEDFLAARPVRIINSSAEGAGDGKWHIRAVVQSRSKTFELDIIGKQVWDACDGETSIRAIIERIAGDHRLNQREAEVSTVAFLTTLARKGLIRVA